MYQACQCCSSLPNQNAGNVNTTTLPLSSGRRLTRIATDWDLFKYSGIRRQRQPVFLLHPHVNRFRNSIEREDKWSLLGMTALVTGGTRGIGYEYHYPRTQLEPFNVHSSLYFSISCGLVYAKARDGGGTARIWGYACNENELGKCLKDWTRSVFRLLGRGRLNILGDHGPSYPLFEKQIRLLFQLPSNKKDLEEVYSRTPLRPLGDPAEVFLFN